MFEFVPGHQSAVRGDDPPPRQTLADREDRPYGAGGSCVAGLLGHLPVGRNFSRAKGRHHRTHPKLEFTHRSGSC